MTGATKKSDGRQLLRIAWRGTIIESLFPIASRGDLEGVRAVCG